MLQDIPYTSVTYSNVNLVYVLMNITTLMQPMEKAMKRAGRCKACYLYQTFEQPVKQLNLVGHSESFEKA
jgi:protein-arginine kinase activator protein McsA